MKRYLILYGSVLMLLLINGIVFGQDVDNYLLGEEPQLQIVVYVFGEVKKPGEYRVPDNTNVVRLLSSAGGSTEFSNLNEVVITRYEMSPLANSDRSSTPPPPKKQIIKYNVKKYFADKNAPPPPTLKPGDIIYVKTNKWRTWRTVAAVMRDLAIVATAYFAYLRVTD